MAKAALLEHVEMSSSALMIFLTRATTVKISTAHCTMQRTSIRKLTGKGHSASNLVGWRDGGVVVRHDDVVLYIEWEASVG